MSREMAGPVPDGAFNSYDLGRVLQALAEVAEERPRAPGAQSLRGAAITWLPWDRRRKMAFHDPSFEMRYKWLRIRTVGSDLGGNDVEIAHVMRELAELIREVQDSEEPF